MAESFPQAVVAKLEQHAQHHVVKWADELNDDDRRRLQQQIEEADFEQVTSLIASQGGDKKSADGNSLAERAEPPRNLIGQTADNDAEAFARGEAALRAGKVGVILVAGGQGSRLGFDHAKGMFPIGPVSNRTLFQVFCEQLLASSRKYGVTIPYFIMTSDTTHDETVAFFEQHARFGLDADAVLFFRQKMMPAVDAETGQVLMEDKASLALSPDGHGGMPDALARNGLFDEMQSRGIEHLYYHQVDNPVAKMCDPRFIGHHILTGSEFSTKVVDKVSAEERMGVLVTADESTRIIEYIDFPKTKAAETDAAGQLRFRAGNTAMHVFERSFLEHLAADPQRLPFHVSVKKVAHINDAGESVEPETENAWKFERFIFDALPFAKNPLVLEADRASEFLPVKNKTGNDSPETCRAGLTRHYTNWLAAAGVNVKEGTQVEISPLLANEPADCVGQIESGFVVDDATVFTPDGPKVWPE